MDNVQERASDAGVDVATNSHGIMYRTNFTDRVEFEVIHLRRAGDQGAGRSTIKYDPELDAPSGSMSLESTAEERLALPDTAEFMVVGVILSKDADRHTTATKDPSRNKTLEKERREMEIQEDQHYLRVVVPMQDITLRRPSTTSRVFFFAEFYEQVEDITNHKAKVAALNVACREAAVRDRIESVAENDERVDKSADGDEPTSGDAASERDI
ncbi:hypothetical protein B0A48_17198 [Cryoendolithus antarcticus]|uniref:Uncharacterized protein n=1 Tax=Cryoendolithus antarcticus TaxID=1507870 RepID=A0A1V8SC38_9PEZI|nr:hypothetical protein B0A48_17198 [Cryoendolithus antarcticus]